MFEQSIEVDRLVRADVDDVREVIPELVTLHGPVELDIRNRSGLTLRAPIVVKVGPPVDHNGVTWWWLDWSPVSHKALLPSFVGRLEALGLVNGTLLTLSGSYRPPLSIVGAAIDKVKLAELARDSLQTFLTQVGREIDAVVQRARAAGPRRPPEYPADLVARHA
jgi:hypothetical protein